VFSNQQEVFALYIQKSRGKVSMAWKFNFLCTAIVLLRVQMLCFNLDVTPGVPVVIRINASNSKRTPMFAGYVILASVTSKNLRWFDLLITPKHNTKHSANLGKR